MSIKSEYEKRIEAYIESNPNCRMGRVHRLEVEGQVMDLPVFRLPIKYLVFNVENGRFAADLRSLEKDLGRKLNTMDAKDADRVKHILLDKSPSDTKRLRDDLKKRGQVEPGIITVAGVVINANRRMATLMELHKETSDDRYAYLEVVVLPSNVSDIEIYKIEAREQYGEDFLVDYPAVNVLLKIKEGLDKGVSTRELAVLLGKKEKDIEEHSRQLKLLEQYSKYAFGKIDYRKIEEARITEIITDVEKNIRKFISEGRKPIEIKKLLEIQFAYIKSGCTYRDIRDFGKYSSQPNIEKAYTKSLSELKDEKVSPESFKENIDDINLSGKIKKDADKPVALVLCILDRIKEFQDKQYKISAEVKKNLKEISKIINKLIDK